MSLTGKKILIGITGGIAAYKVCELIRMFKKKGWIVCLDGVGCQEDFKLVTKMNVDYVQGEKMIEFIPEDSIEKFLSELAEGGILNDI